MWRGMNVSFRDMLFLLVFAYLVVGALALAHVAKNDEDQSKGQTPPGNVIVEMFWDKAIDADVDLWVQAPGDVPVGYSNKSGAVFNLVRDDLGKGGDPNSMNYEVAYGPAIGRASMWSTPCCIARATANTPSAPRSSCRCRTSRDECTRRWRRISSSPSRGRRRPCSVSAWMRKASLSPTA